MAIRRPADLFGSLAGYFHLGKGTRESSSALQVDSTTGGFLGPRMTTTQREAISTPAEGLIVYDTTLKKTYQVQDGDWVELGGGGGGGITWSAITVATNLAAGNGYKSSAGLTHALPTPSVGDEIVVYVNSDTLVCLVTQPSGVLIRYHGKITPSGTAWGMTLNRARFVCTEAGYWDIVDGERVGLGNTALPVQPMMMFFRGEDYDATTGVWIDRSQDENDLYFFRQAVGGAFSPPTKNIGAVFDYTVKYMQTRRGVISPGTLTELFVFSTTSSGSQGVVSRCPYGQGNWSSAPYLLIGYPGSYRYCTTMGSSMDYGYHATPTSPTCSSSLSSFLCTISGVTFTRMDVNGTTYAWTSPYGNGGYVNASFYPMVTFVGGDPYGDNGVFNGEITDIMVWTVELSSAEIAQANEYVRALRSLY